MLEYLEGIIAFCALLGGIIASYTNMNLKIKEIEVKISNFESKLEDMKKERIEFIHTIDKNNDRIWDKLEAIDKKLDDKLIDISKMKAEHDLNMNKCNFGK